MSYLNIQIQIIQMMSDFIQVELLSVLKETDVSSEDTCVLMFGSICSSSAYDPELEWHVRIPNTNKPPYQPPQPQVSTYQLNWPCWRCCALCKAFVLWSKAQSQHLCSLPLATIWRLSIITSFLAIT